MLIVNGGTSSALTKSFENCTQIRPKAVAIQTAGGATSNIILTSVSKTYIVRDQTGMMRPIVVKAYTLFLHYYKSILNIFLS